MIAMMMLTMMIAAWINWQCVTLTDFSKHGQVDFYKAADSISDYLTSTRDRWGRGSHGLSARRARRTKSSRPEGPKAGPKGRKLEVGARRAPRLLFLYIC